jgi:cytochrome c oxidase subunit 1
LVGGVILLASALLFIANLATFHRGARANIDVQFEYAIAVHPPRRVPSSLNGFGLWNALVFVLMLVAYGWPIAQFFVRPPPQAVVHRVSGQTP